MEADPDAVFIKEPAFGELLARGRTDCGHTELRCESLKALKQIYRKRGY